MSESTLDRTPRHTAAAVFLTPLKRYDDFALLLLRVLVGTFLIWGVADNLFDGARMREFEDFLAGFGFPVPHLLAPLSVWAQAAAGCAFVLGVLTRWAGIVCAINFVVALVMVDSLGGIRSAFPSACLVAIGVYLATNGAGRYSIDRLLQRSGS